ncbi:MAG: hypothetical protein PVF27_00395 [Gemmatimonadales bacterium]|jgi:hypothetical protein
MAFYRCRICTEDGDELCEDVTVTIETVDRDGEPQWYGTLSMTRRVPLETGQRYRLELEDGRSGQFAVRRSTFAGGDTQAIAIVGVSPLA